MNITPVADLTLDQLVDLLRVEMKRIARETVQEVIQERPLHSHDQRAIFDIPLLQLDPRHTALTLIGREGIYDDDDGR